VANPIPYVEVVYDDPSVVKVTRRKGNTSSSILLTVNLDTELKLTRRPPPEPPPPPAPEPPPPPPPPPPPAPAVDVVRESLNLAKLINFDGVTDRYQRFQNLLVLDGAFPTGQIKITGADLSAGGVRRLLSNLSYTLLFDDQPVASLSLASPLYYASFTVDLANISHGWHRLGLAGATGESVQTYFVFVLKDKTAPDPALMPVVRNYYERAMSSTPSEHRWAWVPATFAPRTLPITPRSSGAPRVPPPTVTSLDRAGLHCEPLVPVRFGDTHRPVRNKDGILSTFDTQSYFWSQLTAKYPTVPCMDGPRGVGTVSMATHLEVGLAGSTQGPSGGNIESLGFIENTYFTDAWRVGKVKKDGRVITILGWKHRELPAQWQDAVKNGVNYHEGLLHSLELVGDWSAIPAERRGLREVWGMAWDRRTVTFDPAQPPSTDPREMGLVPHRTGMVIFLPDSQNNRIVRAEFPADTHFDYNRTKATEFITAQDPWDCVGENGVLYVSERKSHRICAYSMDTGALLRVVVQGASVGVTIDVNREVLYGASTLLQRQAQPCCAPEGLFLQDGWLYFASKAQAQVRRVNLTTGALEVVRPIYIDGNSKFAKLALSDGTFGPRGSTFTWTWSNAQQGGPEIYIGAVKQNIWWNMSGGTGDWFAHAGYGTAGCAQFGKCLSANMLEGISHITKSQPGDKVETAAVTAGRLKWDEHRLLHGHDGFGFYGAPLPWGIDSDIDAYLTFKGH
jgi:hypothetical protein